MQSQPFKTQNYNYNQNQQPQQPQYQQSQSQSQFQPQQSQFQQQFAQQNQYQQAPQFQPQNTFQNKQNSQHKSYDETVIKLVGFSFPFNHLLLVSLMKRIPNNPQSDYKELYFGFVTCVTGIGQANNRTYDFNQKIVQKFSLKDLQVLAFALKQLAINNTSILPFTKFTNSGSGAKTLYLQYKENLENFNNMQTSNHQQQYQTQQSQNMRKMESNIVLGGSFGNIKINIPLSKPDAYSIGDIIEKLYNTGMNLEINDQIQLNTRLNNNINSGVQSSPISNPVTIG